GADEETFAADAGRDWLREVHEGDTPGAVPRRDGARGAMARALRADRPDVPEGREWPAAHRPRAHAADVLPPALVQSLRPGRGRSAVRLAAAARVRRDRSGPRAGPG